MASFIVGSLLADEANGNVNLGVDSFKVMLLDSTATPDQDTWAKRSDVTGEVSGTGYTAGGNAATVTVGTYDAATNSLPVTLGGTSWPSSTITARYAVYYKDRGGAASADELVAVVDFGADVSSSSGTFTLSDSIITKQA